MVGGEDAEVKMHFTEMLLLPCGIAVRTLARESVSNFFRIPFTRQRTSDVV